MYIAELYEIFRHHPAVTIDSRKCPVDSIFFALRGERTDGNLYAEAALKGGCAYAVVDNPNVAKDNRYIVVDDVLKTLQQLAHFHRKALGTPIIGITGTNGKTTTKELLAAVLSTKYNLLYTEGNLNNHIGVPLTLLRLNYDHEMAVIEMGASHVGDIRELVDIVNPNYGIITNIGKGHLEGFGSFEGVLQTKKELYDYIRRTRGMIFIRKEDSVLQSIAQGIEQVTYGESDAFASGRVVSCNPYLVFEWKQQGKIHVVETKLIGDYNLHNALSAVAVGRYFKIPAERISRAIAAYEPTNNRSQLKTTASNKLIIDAYNANPSSMRLAIENFANIDCASKTVILGDMKELGEESLNLHREIVGLLEEKHFDNVLLCGENFNKANEGYLCFPTTEDLVDYLKQNPPKNQYILIKGSHSMGLEKLVDIL